MFKKCIAICLMLSLSAIFAGCAYNYAPEVNESDVATTSVDIQDYLTNGVSYYGFVSIAVGKLDVQSKGLSGDAAFDSYVELWSVNPDAPKDDADKSLKPLVESYAKKFEAAEESKVAYEDCRKTAEAIIKEEYVIYKAFESLKSENGYSITMDTRKAAAKDFGGESYTVEENLSDSSYYPIDTFIKYSVIVALLTDGELPYGISAEESSEVSEASESSEVSAESVESIESSEVSAESAESAESSESSESSEISA